MLVVALQWHDATERPTGVIESEHKISQMNYYMAHKKVRFLCLVIN